jgi:hypothetical protein
MEEGMSENPYQSNDTDEQEEEQRGIDWLRLLSMMFFFMNLAVCSWIFFSV